MASEAKHTPLPWRVRKHEPDGEMRDCFVEANDVNGFPYGAEVMGDDEYREGSGGVARKLADAELIVTAVNERAILLAERDAALVAVEGIERFLGIRDGASGLEQIARDIKSGTFPKKSEQTLAEEAEAARLHNLITASIKSGAPGLSETTCSAIAQSVALKIRHAVSSLPTAQVKG